MKKVRLKGGSLSGTYLCTSDSGEQFVRKDVSLVANREYGFQRWYSQLKRMQRYSVLFPEIFPRLLGYGKSGSLAYFDMEYIQDAVTVQEFLTQTSDRGSIQQMFGQLVKVMDKMHQMRIPSTAEPMELYISEEIEQKIQACMGNRRFQEFVRYPELYFNGEKVPTLISGLDAFKQMAQDAYRHTTETFTHGNLTLENILYQPRTGRIIFIDPYEENIIDSALAEYSQVLQSCNSKYEFYNAGTAVISGNSVEMRLVPCDGIDIFNEMFFDFMRERLSADDIQVVRLLEVSQFARMLPFKMELDENKMIFFYALGSYLFDQLRKSAARAN